MELDKYIKELLFFNDTIIVSNFGGFEKYTESAQIEDNTGTIHPPSVKIKFKPELKKDSGILSDYIVKKENVSKAEAEKQINQTIIRWNDSLQKGGKIEISNIGFIRSDKNGNKKFELTGNLSDFPEAFGLPVINVKEQQQTTDNKKPIKKDVKKPVVNEKKEQKKPEIKEKKNIKKPIIVKQKEQKEPKKIDYATKKKIIVATLIAVPVIVLIIFASLNFELVTNKFNQSTEYIGSLFSSDKSDNPEDNLDEINFEETETDSIFENTKSVLENYTVINSETNTPITIDKESVASISKVNIIAGSFQNKKFAKRLRNKLNRKGFKAEVLPINQSYYRISVGAFDNIEDAIKDFDRIRMLDNNLAVWVLVN